LLQINTGMCCTRMAI